jgi:hypothetical protein
MVINLIKQRKELELKLYDTILFTEKKIIIESSYGKKLNFHLYNIVLLFAIGIGITN